MADALEGAPARPPRPVARAAVVAYHSSPLLEPGAGDAGGMTVYVCRVAEELARRGVRSDIFTRAISDVPRVAEIAPGVRVVAIDAGPRRPIDKAMLPAYIDEFVAGLRAFSLGQRIAYDVVHSHYWQSGLVAQRIGRAWKVPTVHSNHTLAKVKDGLRPRGDRPETETRLRGEELVISSADVLVASTEEELEQLACLYGAPHDALKTIHPGVDPERFAPGDRAASRRLLGLPQKGAIVLAVGRIQPLKGLTLAVEAIDRLGRLHGRTASLVVVGGASGASGAEEERRLVRLARELGIDDRVFLLGPRPHASLPDHYRAADLLIAPSHSESFGLAALEAHACGIPVVASAVGGLAFVVADGRTGFLVPERDPVAFAHRIELVLSSPDLRLGFGRAARAAAERLSWRATASALLELYDCLVERGMREACTC